MLWKLLLLLAIIMTINDGGAPAHSGEKPALTPGAGVQNPFPD